MATCPNCTAQILLEASECPACAALFGEGSAWRPLPQTPEVEQQLRQRYAASTPAIVTDTASSGIEAAEASKASDAPEFRYQVEFTASGGEYFRIWIVNLALTILTLGLYSAWAKVRKRRYFYSHTRIDGDPFEYRGKPLAILKGRLIAVAVFGAVYATWQFLPSFLWLLIIVVIAVAPWLIVRSLAFNARNSAFRNTCFQFRGTYLQCLGLLLWNGMIVLLTLGIGYPYLKSRFVQFMAANHCYGTTQFKVPELKPIFFRIYSWAIGVGILCGLLAVITAGLAGLLFFGGDTTRNGDSVAAGALVAKLNTMGGYLTWLIVFAYLRARLANATFTNLTIGPVRFECVLRARDVLLLYLTNIVAILATLGLATPWAAVRTMRYRTQKMTVIAAGGLDGFAAARATQVTAAGEEVTEMFDFDLSI